MDNDEECCAAAHAIDKDLSTNAVTSNGGEDWLKLEFGKSHFIHKIMIFSRFYTDWYHPGGWCFQTQDNFKNCADINNNVDVAVYQGDVKQKSCGTLQLTYGLEQSDQIYTLVCNAEGDTVKLSKDSASGTIAVYEVVVTGTGMYTLNFEFLNLNPKFFLKILTLKFQRRIVL